MATNLSGRLSSVIKVTRAKLALSTSLPDMATRSLPNSVSRLVSSSTHHLHQNQDHHHQSSSDTKIPSQTPDKENAPTEENDESSDDEHVNKDTGEIGGPRGPEPTRYGDWEKGGRCSDF